MRRFLFIFAIVLFSLPILGAHAAEHRLVIAREAVNITGKPVSKITVNSAIPGPTLRFKAGEDAVIHVTNTMDEPSSIHWHGLLLPGEMDGVPGFNGFPGIKPQETFTYRFKIQFNRSSKNVKLSLSLYRSCFISEYFFSKSNSFLTPFTN